ncbi:unnamed protein product [Clonostachys solani]|uniref:Trichothecene 3-O-acetyltransferase-like N-terminal domain-containing protein n=1 Tax=Clonostachys solani TaxID=160281 RepID=A0A9N9W5I4_9HYPO|nr:unnamed protein product [Clonostachys solani]
MAYQVLSTWNQCAPRGYVRQWFCFPCRQDVNLKNLRNHLVICLEQLSARFPFIKKRVCLLSNPAGYVAFGPGEFPQVPLEVLDQRNTFAFTYGELKAQGFPAKAFVGPSFGDLPYSLAQGQPGVPVFEVHARVIKGGLLLCNYCHHSVTDGLGVDHLMRTFAELSQLSTQDLSVKRPVDVQVDIPQKVITDFKPELKSMRYEQLLRLCPEYRQLRLPTGPTQCLMKPEGIPLAQIQKTGRTFVFSVQKLEALQRGILCSKGGSCRKRAPSKFTCLAAITWAHVTKARLCMARRRSQGSMVSYPKRIRIMLCTNWSHRAFGDIMMHASGNTVALPVSSIDTATIFAACSTNKTESFQALSAIAQTIESTVNSVDDDFVALRTAMIRASPDPRYIGIDLDPRDPSSFIFNTWRHYGTEVQKWGLPGLGYDGESQDGSQTGRGASPDAIRRSQSEWNMGAGLILPAGNDPNIFEVVVTLAVDEMPELCGDPSWRQLVDRIIE